MISPRLARVLLLALWTAGCAAARPAAEGPLVDSLEIEGNAAVPDGAIRARILTAGTSWVPFSERHYLDEAVLETDLRRVVRLYQARGFYKARIAERTVTTSGEGEVEVLIRVEEGPPTLVSRLAVEGLDGLSEPLRARVLEGLPLAEGAVFAEEAFDQTKALLQERLREAGYAEAEVEGSARVELEQDRAEVSLAADAGERYRFGRLFVAGANRVPRNRILDQAREDVVEGAWYSESALSLAEGRIFDLGVFSAVKVTRGAPDRRAGKVPVVISVREAPFRTVRLGVGVGVDKARQELPRVVGEWTNRNFFGGLRRLTVSGNLALVFRDDLLDGLGRPVVGGGAEVEFSQPNLLGPALSLDASLGYERGVGAAWTFHAAKGRIGLPWRVSRRFSVVPSFNYALFKLDPDSGAEPLPGQVDQEMALDECATRDALCKLAYLEQRFVYDRRDNPIDPNAGFFVSFALQEGSERLGGGFNYLRLQPEARAYVPLGRHVLAARVTAGLLMPSEGESSSVLTRFHLGGGTTQRGFGTQQLSPRMEILDSDGSREYLPVGGNGMFAANLEARFRLPANLGLVAFLDAGQVQPSIGDLAPRETQLAAGLGLRYRTLFGPVRADVGYRINDPGLPVLYSDGSVGTLRGLPRWSFHLTIGEAF